MAKKSGRRDHMYIFVPFFNKTGKKTLFCCGNFIFKKFMTFSSQRTISGH
jgi:hypothetical protein